MTMPSRLDRPGIAVISTARPWHRTLSTHSVAHGGVDILQVALSVDEIADNLSPDAVLVDDTDSYLTMPTVLRYQQRGIAVLGFYDRTIGEAGRSRLEDELGCDEALPADSAATTIVAAIQTAVRRRQAERIEVQLPDTPDELLTGLGTITPHPPTPEEPQESRELICVAGSGATEIAVALADAFGRRSTGSCILIDVNTIHPRLAQRLGLYPTKPGVDNIHAVTEALNHGTDLDMADLAYPFHVITGIAHPNDWSAYPASDLVHVATTAAARYRYVVCDIDHHLEQLGIYGDPEDRFGAARMLVAAADQLVLSLEPTPIGVTEGLEWIATASALTSNPIHVVFTRATTDTHQRTQLTNELTRSFPAASLHFLPHDSRVLKAAWQGITTPRGPYTKAIHLLADTLSPLPAAPRRFQLSIPSRRSQQP